MCPRARSHKGCESQKAQRLAERKQGDPITGDFKSPWIPHKILGDPENECMNKKKREQSPKLNWNPGKLKLPIQWSTTSCDIYSILR